MFFRGRAHCDLHLSQVRTLIKAEGGIARALNITGMLGVVSRIVCLGSLPVQENVVATIVYCLCVNWRFLSRMCFACLVRVVALPQIL